MTQLQSISNCFRFEADNSYNKLHAISTQKENNRNKKSINYSLRGHQTGPQQAHKNIPQKLRKPSTELDTVDPQKEQSNKFQSRQEKPSEQKNQGKSSIQIDVRPQQEIVPVQGASKVQLVREIQMQISLLESKSKQPGIKTADIQSLGYQIYDKIDQYYINYGINNNKYKFSWQFHTSLLNKISTKAEDQNGRGKKSTQRSSSGLSQATSQQDQMGFETRKVFKTSNSLDISVSSVSETEKNEEDLPIFQTKMTQSQLAGLDKPLRSQSDAQRECQSINESHYQLKESIRVMEERIVFLIHRLEQTKTEVNELKEEKVQLESKLKKELNLNKQLKSQHDFLCELHQKNLQEIEKLYKIIQNLKQKYRQLQEFNTNSQKQLHEQKEQIECYRMELADKQNKIAKIQATLKLKTQQYSELALNYRIFEEQEQIRKMELVTKLEESENEKARLKQTIREYKSRLQIQGLSFKFQQAHKLKQLFEDSSTIHEKQISKIEKQYSTIVQSLKQQLKQSTNSRRSLQTALIESLGLKKLSFPQQIQLTSSSCSFNNSTWSTQFADNTCEELSKEFVTFVQKYKNIEMEVKKQKEVINKYQDRLEILKQECQERFIENKDIKATFSKKNQQIEELNKEIEELKKYLRQNISSNINKRKKNNELIEATTSVRRSKLESRIIQISLVKQSVSDHSELTLQSFIKKKVVNTPKNIIRFILKLIQFSQQLQSSTRKKLPSLTPHSVLLSVKKLQDLQIVFSIISKKQEQEGLIYQAPQIVLGFAESGHSHCWTIGVILDEMLHGRKFHKSIQDILSHKDNYTIMDDNLKNIQVLHQMLRKNQKQRITLQQAKRRLQLIYHSYR